MDIQNKTVLVLGGFGLVGSAVARKLVPENPKHIIITSLFLSEAKEAVSKLEKEFPQKGKNFFIPWGGDIFVRFEYKDQKRTEILLSSSCKKTPKFHKAEHARYQRAYFILLRYQARRV